jgi:hypothetical protein
MWRIIRYIDSVAAVVRCSAADITIPPTSAEPLAGSIRR